MWLISKSPLFIFTAVVICLAGGSIKAAIIACPIPLETGNRWTYEGKIETTLVGSSTVFTTNICWVMEVVDSMKSTNAEAAVVHGFLNELPWYEPGQAPGFCVLLNVSNRVYKFEAQNEKEARSILQDVMNQSGKFSAEMEDFNELLVLPLAKGSRWGSDTEREDGRYCWCVEKAQSSKLRIKGYSGNTLPLVYTLAYRTNPEDVLLEIAAGLGITRCVYVHHGTVASVDVRLVSFKSPL